MSYLGTLASNFTSDMRSNSLVHLGWIYDKKGPKEFLINTDSGCNSGRFVNSSCDDYPENCRIVIGIIGGEVAAVLVSTKEIRKGDELFWQYGDTYWEKKNEIEDESPEESFSSIDCEGLS